MPDLTLASDYADAIITEWELRRNEITEPVETLYIGGGTPSSLSVTLLDRIINKVGRISQFKEVTLEVNPEDVNQGSVGRWKTLGINRISMGVQSFNDEELKVVGRRHSAADALKAIDILRECDIENISLDLIYGLPGQTIESWQQSLDIMMHLRPEHLSAYSLTYEPRTRLTAMLNTGKIEAVDDDTVAEMYGMLCKSAHDNGYKHYEISNFSLPGHKAVHNSSYWDGTPYLGLGPSAHSFDGNVRRVNPSNIRKWISDLKTGNTAYEIECETKANKFNDLLITAMRTAQGLDIKRVKVRRRLPLLCAAYTHIKNGNIVVNGRFLSIPEDKWIISDAILTDLIQE